MKRKTFKGWCFSLATIWGTFTIVYSYFNFNRESLGTAATLGGIALMFAFLYWQTDLKP